jgi:NADH-quinone oxidoreductase subunit B
MNKGERTVPEVKMPSDFIQEEENFLLEKLVMTTKSSGLIDWLKRWGQSNSLWGLPFGTSCCALEFLSLSGSQKRLDDIGCDIIRHSPERSDLMIIGGTITEKQVPILKSVYDKMLAPKWVLAMGSCAASGGFYRTYSVVQGVSREVPVDVYIPGCPPTTEAVIEGLKLIKERIVKGVKKTPVIKKKPSSEKSVGL